MQSFSLLAPVAGAKRRHEAPLHLHCSLLLWYMHMFQLWYKTYRATSSLRLADTAGAARALAGVL